MADKECKHEDLTPLAVFYCENLKETYLARVCETCGTCFLLVGYKPEVE